MYPRRNRGPQRDDDARSSNYLGGNAGAGGSSRNFDFTANDPASVAPFDPGPPFGLNGRPRPVSFKSFGAQGGVQFGPAPDSNTPCSET